jgi:hypothetical protein
MLANRRDTVEPARLLDVEIHSQQDEWPQQNGEYCRDDSLGFAQVGEVVVRVRDDQAYDEVDRDEQSAA